MWFLLLMRSGSLCLLWANRAHWSKDIYQEAVLDSVTLCLESLPKLSQVSCEYSCQILGTICRQKSLSTGTMWESNFCLHNTWHMFGNKPVIQCFSFGGDIQNLNSNIGDFKKEHEALWCKEHLSSLKYRMKCTTWKLFSRGPLNSMTGNWENNEVAALPGMSRI